MIGLILEGATFLTLSIGFMGLPRYLAELIGSLNLSPFVLILMLTGFFIMLGGFLDGISMVVLTMAVLLPTVQKAGFDLIWFDIFNLLIVEMAQITPPVGFHLFVLQNLTGREITCLARTAMPLFFLILADGRIDSMITSAVTGVESRVWDHVRHYYEINAWYPKNIVLVNLKRFNALPPETRAIVMRAAEMAEKRGWQRANWRHRNRRKLFAAMALRSTLRRCGWTANCNASVSDFQVNGSRR